MKHLLNSFILVILLSFTGMVSAESVVEVVTPTINKGDTAWMIMATVLVILMVIPGLALFYGGMVRAKNMLSVLMQVFVIFSMMAILWALYGYTSVSYTHLTLPTSP
jgi:Amt family ammonium transporter